MTNQKRNYLLIYALLTTAYFFSYFFRVSTTVVLPILQETLSIKPDVAGFISSMYFYTYALMQPLCGILNDKFGPSRTVGIGIIITAIGSICFGLGNSVVLLVIGRLLMGIGLSPMLSGVLVFQSSVFSGERYALMSGISMAIGNFGSVVSVAPLSSALDLFGRESVFCALSLITMLISILLLIDARKNKTAVESSLGRELNVRFGIALTVMKNSRQLKIVVISWAVYFGALMAYQGLWALSWFKAVYPDSTSLAKLGATMIGVGVMVGNLLGGKISSDSTNRHEVLKFFSLALFIVWVMLVTMFSLKTSIYLTILASILLGVVSGMTFVQLTAAVNEISPEGQGGAVFGLVNSCTFFGVMVFQWISGVIIKKANITNSLEMSYLICFIIIAITLIIPVIINRFMKPLERQKVNLATC